MARRGGGILATSFLSDSSQDSACSRERSPKSPSGGGDEIEAFDSQCTRLSSRPLAENGELIQSTERRHKQAWNWSQSTEAADTAVKVPMQTLRHTKGGDAAISVLGNSTTEAYFIGTPPDSGRIQGKVANTSDHSQNEGKFAAVPEAYEETMGNTPSTCSWKRNSIASRRKASGVVPSLDFGIQHWPASPRDSIIRPRQSAETCSSRGQGSSMLLSGQHKASAEPQLGRSGASRCSSSSLSAREQPAFFCSSSQKTQAAGSNLAKPRLRKGQFGKASIADLKAAAAALGAPDCPVGALNKPRAKSEERSASRRSMTARSAPNNSIDLALGRSCRRSCSPHSRSPSASSSRLNRSSSVDGAATETLQKVTAASRTSGHMSDWLASCTHYVSAAHNACSARTPLIDQAPQQKSAPSASRGTATATSTPNRSQQSDSGIKASTSRVSEAEGTPPTPSSPWPPSSSRSSLRVDAHSARDRRLRLSSSRDQHKRFQHNASTTSLQAEGELRPALAASGTRSVPTPGGPSPWGALSGRHGSMGKAAATTPERGRLAAQTRSKSSSGTSPQRQAPATRPSTTTPERERPSAKGAVRSSPPSRASRTSSSIMRTSLTQRCPSLTRRLGMT